jgi:hypothetical protein
MPTPLRAVRVASPLWEAARTRAAETGTTITAVVVAALEEFAMPTSPDIEVVDDAADEQDRPDLHCAPPSPRVL